MATNKFSVDVFFFFPLALSHAKTKEALQRLHFCTHLRYPLGVHDATGIRNSRRPQTMWLENQIAHSPIDDHDKVRPAPPAHEMRTDMIARTKLRSSYDHSVEAVAAMDSTQPAQICCAEFQHAALTLALAITNGRKCFF